MKPLITYEVHGHVAHITLRRPERRNALNAEMSALLHQYWQRFAAGNERVALLSAEGDHFCAGVDVADPSREAWKGVPNVGVQLDKPLVCAVQGWAVGAGFTLTMMSDLCVVDETGVLTFNREDLDFVNNAKDYSSAFSMEVELKEIDEDIEDILREASELYYDPYFNDY